MTALHGTGQSLQTDVVRAAVSAEGDKADRAVGINLALTLQRLVSRLNAGDRRPCVLKRTVNPRHIPGSVGEYARANLGTPCRICHNHWVFRWPKAPSLARWESLQPGQARCPLVRRSERLDRTLSGATIFRYLLLAHIQVADPWPTTPVLRIISDRDTDSMLSTRTSRPPRP